MNIKFGKSNMVMGELFPQLFKSNDLKFKCEFDKGNKIVQKLEQIYTAKLFGFHH